MPKQLSGQHDTRWIPEGFPGAGHLMVFNNDLKDGDRDYSAIFEIVPPVDASGQYVVPETGPFGPAEPVWTYTDKVSFHSRFISGAHRLENGNTFICSGAQGRLLEVTREGEIAWEYWNPYTGDADVSGRLDEDPYAVFRATKIASDHPAIAGKDLKPMDPQPEIVPPAPPKETEN